MHSKFKYARCHHSLCMLALLATHRTSDTLSGPGKIAAEFDRQFCSYTKIALEVKGQGQRAPKFVGF